MTRALVVRGRQRDLEAEGAADPRILVERDEEEVTRGVQVGPAPSEDAELERLGVGRGERDHAAWRQRCCRRRHHLARVGEVLDDVPHRDHVIGPAFGQRPGGVVGLAHGDPDDVAQEAAAVGVHLDGARLIAGVLHDGGEAADGGADLDQPPGRDERPDQLELVALGARGGDQRAAIVRDRVILGGVVAPQVGGDGHELQRPARGAAVVGEAVLGEAAVAIGGDERRGRRSAADPADDRAHRDGDGDGDGDRGAGSKRSSTSMMSR